MKKVGQCLALCLMFSIFLTSCVSNKKHLAAIDALKANHKSEVDQWRSQVNAAKYEIEKLKLQLAERKGENNILAANAEKWEKRVDQLEEQIENLNSRSTSNQADLNQKLRDKEEEINALKEQLATIGQELDRHEQLFNQLLQEMRDSMRYWPTINYAARTGAEEVAVILPESLVFRKRSVTRLEEDGYDALEKIAEVIERYPNMKVVITCHTDNARPRNKSYKDNWNVSLLQSATVVRTLIQEFDLNAGQILPSGKGEFSPRASNESEEGRELNRRIEFVISPASEQLSKAIRGKL
ncbi:MAG: OmpA family protein [Bacteroidota bacterium]